jgi:hypothetical protein
LYKPVPVGIGFMLTGTVKGWVGIYIPIPIPARPLPMNPTGYLYLCRTLVSMVENRLID